MIVLRTLGTAAIEIDASATVTPISSRRFPTLLLLAVEHGRGVPRERITTLVFGDQSATEGAHSLRETIYKLRKLGAPIAATRHGFTIASEDVRVDFAEALAAATVDDETLRAMAGGFLPAFVAAKGEAFAEWLDALRAEQTVALTRRLLTDLDDAMRTAQWPTAERLSRACLGLDTWNERATFALAEIVALGGSKASALQLIDRYIAEVGPQSDDLVRRADARRRRISEGLSATLVGVAPENSASFEAPGAPASPKLVGRVAELATLLDAFDRARSGDSQCIVVAGEPGIGKTRLVTDFAAAAVLRGAHVERVTSQSHDGSRPMGAFVDLVPALLRARGALGCSPASMDALRSLMGGQAQSELPEQAAGAEEHEQRWAAVSRAVMDLCDAIASEGMLVLVIEDAHWLDTLSANTIGRIIGTRRKARIMVVATTRDPRPLVRDLRLTERSRTLTLAPLDAAGARKILDALLPAPERGSSAEQSAGAYWLKSRIADISAGNPLFLISLALHSIAHPGEFEVPGTIVETFAQRIDALSRHAMSVLATCSELGKHSTLARLVRSTEMRKHQLVESLLELTSAGLVLRDGHHAIPAHPLVSEALRGRLPHPARRAVAHSVAATLERDAEAGASPSLWWDAAESWRVADNAERAIHALKQCARHALEIGRPGEAARMLNQAAELPQSSESLRDLTDSLIVAADAATEFALVIRAAGRLRLTREAHSELEMAELRAQFCIHRSDDLMSSRLPRCIQAPHASPAHRVEAGILLLKCADMTGRDDLREIAVDGITTDCLAAVGPLMKLEFELLAESSAGDRVRAASVARALLEHCREVDDKGGSPLKYYQTSATALLLAGFVDEAIQEYGRLFDLAEKRGSPRGQHFAATQLAALHWDCACEDDADLWLGRAQAIAAMQPDLTDDFGLSTLQMERSLFEGQFVEGQRLLDAMTSAGLLENNICRRWAHAAHLAIRSGLKDLDESAYAEASRIGRHRQSSMTGARDFEVAVAVEALLCLGARRDAASILDEYLRDERAEYKRPSRLLARAIQAARNPAPASGLGGNRSGRSRAETARQV